MPRYNAVPEIVKKQMTRLYIKGYTLKYISQETGYSIYTCRLWGARGVSFILRRRKERLRNIWNSLP